MTTLSDAALAYCARGWRVFPVYEIAKGACACGGICNSPGKHPRIAGGFTEASDDPAVLRSWWRQWPRANIGIATGGGLVVIDLDDGVGKSGSDTWIALELEGIDTLEAATGGGGNHLFFACKEKVQSRPGVLQNVDVRADGGYVVVPPSNHISGGVYAWVDPEARLQAIPDEVLAIARKRKERAPSASKVPDVIPKGARNDTLMRLGSRLRNQGLNRAEILAALLATNLRCQPPLEDAEVEAVARSCEQMNIGGEHEFTELGNTKRLVHRFGDQFRYVENAGWVVWNGRRWREDREAIRMHRFARTLLDDMREKGKQADEDDPFGKKLENWARGSSKHSVMKNMIANAKSFDGIHIERDALDKDPMSLNLLNGTLDLTSGKLNPHAPEDMITRLTGVEWDPEAQCEVWERFVLDVCGGDVELVEYLQRAVGYSLTGSVEEHALFFCYGSGCNGKSTFLNALMDVWGEYGGPGASGLLQTHKGNSKPHPTEQADLLNKRLVVCQELDQGAPWAESVVKTLTGGDPIQTRRMHEDPWTLTPTHKLWVAGNSKPIVKESTDGIWRRMKLIPFTVSFRGQEDPTLGRRLQMEVPGILRWAMDGCRAWQERGLDAPKCVQTASETYRAEMDYLIEFLEACFKIANPAQLDVRADKKEIWRMYVGWCQRNGEKGFGTSRALFKELRERGFKEARLPNGIRAMKGLDIKTGQNGEMWLN